MQQLKKVIVEMESTSEVLKDASEYMKRLEKQVEYQEQRYKQAQTVLLALYMKGQADPDFCDQIPEVVDYMKEAGDHERI